MFARWYVCRTGYDISCRSIHVTGWGTGNCISDTILNTFHSPLCILEVQKNVFKSRVQIHSKYNMRQCCLEYYRLCGFMSVTRCICWFCNQCGVSTALLTYYYQIGKEADYSTLYFLVRSDHIGLDLLKCVEITDTKLSVLMCNGIIYFIRGLHYKFHHEYGHSKVIHW